MGKAGSTKIDPDEDKRLMEKWSRSDLWPKTGEQASSISGPAGNPNAFSNFCPEVAYERFGIFASFFIGHYDSVDRERAHSRLAKEGAEPEDWRWHWQSLKPMHYTECPLYSPLSHDAAKQGKGPFVPSEDRVLTIKPGAFGISLNLHAALKYLRDWWGKWKA